MHVSWAGVLSSLSLSVFLCFSWATHSFGCDSPLIALPGKSHKPLGWNVLSKALPLSLSLWEKTSRENSGVDNLSVISTSGTESLIPSNLSLRSHCDAPPRGLESVVRIWETNSKSKMMIRGSARWIFRAPQAFILLSQGQKIFC